MERWLNGRITNVRTQALYLSQFNPNFISSSLATRLLSDQMYHDINYFKFVIVDKEGSIVNSNEGPVIEINVLDREYLQKSLNDETAITGFF
ncbi:hypothetical protein BHU72_03995 [Desulfuribacillus stibiiarsenatis]|uniref:Uncharacterized protein n=1 Tax=Desulfuribacillus stibiiarsenatis TaxID=1390249 RepID=A0A1E5L581_9FIRM|nr:hypothetical protein [Desulfuribacillus stibiiarsenatis]OEH85266.1 hypothetical protein BHU72_03995 [Desulfuribacillus stibiiarsenatis]